MKFQIEISQKNYRIILMVSGGILATIGSVIDIHSLVFFGGAIWGLNGYALGEIEKNEKEIPRKED